MRALCVIFLLIFVATLHTEEAFSVDLKLYPVNVSLDETFTLEVKLRFPKSYQVDTMALRNNLLKHSILSPAPFVILTEDEKVAPYGAVITYVLQPKQIGEFPVSLWTIFFKSQNSKETRQIVSDLQRVKVTMPTVVGFDQLKQAPPLGFAPRLPIEMSFLNKTFRDLQQKQEPMRNVILMYDRTFPWREWGKLGIGLAALLVIVWFPKRKRTQTIQSEERILLARDRAMQALQANLSTGPTVYIQLSDILRDYLGERYEIATDKETTQEVLKDLKNRTEFDFTRRQMVARILGGADRVKFALYTPPPQDCQEARTLAHHIISMQP